MRSVTRGPVGLHREGTVRRPGHKVQLTVKIHDVALRLAGEFAPMLPLDMVSAMVSQACRDLADEVPAESLPEFVHHAARQRLMDAVGTDPMCRAERRRPVRRAAS